MTCFAALFAFLLVVVITNLGMGLLFKTIEGLAWLVRRAWLLPYGAYCMVRYGVPELGAAMCSPRVGRFILLSSWWWASLAYVIYACCTY